MTIADQRSAERVTQVQPWWRTALRSELIKYVWAVGIVALAGVIASQLNTAAGVRIPGTVLLAGVVLAAVRFGSGPALAAAGVGFVELNDFLLTNPVAGLDQIERLLTLLVFVLAAVFVGSVAGRLRSQQERARRQVETFRALLAASQAMSGREWTKEFCTEITHWAGEIGVEAVAICPESAGRADMLPAAALEAARRALQWTHTFDHEGWRFARLTEDLTVIVAWRTDVELSEEQAIAMALLIDQCRTSLHRSAAIRQKVEMDSLAATERLRAALMASISHDFRTPLATIMASASSLQTDRDKFSAATQSDMLMSIQEEAERLNRYVANILAMTRLDNHALDLRRDWIDPGEVMEAAAARIKRRLGARSLSVRQPAVAHSIYADPILLEQALTNVLENAVTYTPASAAIVLSCEESDDEVRIAVEDDGPGVAADDLPRMFEKFRRLSHPSNSGHGAGLGLAISKGLTEAMGGSIVASSARSGGPGVRVTISFPVAASVQPA